MAQNLVEKLQADFLNNIINNTRKEYHSLLVTGVMNRQKNVDEILRNALTKGVVESTQPVIKSTGNNIEYINKKLEKILETDPHFIFNGLSHAIARVTFIKKNSELRTMWCTRNSDFIEKFNPRESMPTKSVEEMEQERNKQLLQGSYRVFDISKLDWRRLNINTLVDSDTEVSVMFYPISSIDWANSMRLDLNDSFDLEHKLEDISRMNAKLLVSKKQSENNNKYPAEYLVSLATSSLDDNTTNETNEEIISETEQNEVSQTNNVEQAPVANSEDLSASILIKKDYIRQSLKQGIARAKFIKKDGSEREIWCTLNKDILDGQGVVFKKELTQEEQIAKNEKENLTGRFSVYDISARGWRFLDLNTLVYDNEFPIILFDIEKPMWAEFMTNKKVINYTEQVSDYNPITLRFNSEDFIEAFEISDYSVDGLIEKLIPKDLTEINSRESIAIFSKDNPEEILNIASKNIMRATFKKVNGDSRVMWFTLIPEILESENSPTIKTTTEKQIETKSLEVFDIENLGLRKLNLNQLLYSDDNVPLIYFSLKDKGWANLLGGNSEQNFINYYDSKKSDRLKTIDSENNGDTSITSADLELTPELLFERDFDNYTISSLIETLTTVDTNTSNTEVSTNFELSELELLRVKNSLNEKFNIKSTKPENFDSSVLILFSKILGLFQSFSNGSLTVESDSESYNIMKYFEPNEFSILRDVYYQTIIIKCLNNKLGIIFNPEGIFMVFKSKNNKLKLVGNKSKKYSLEKTKLGFTAKSLSKDLDESEAKVLYYIELVHYLTDIHKKYIKKVYSKPDEEIVTKLTRMLTVVNKGINTENRDLKLNNNLKINTFNNSSILIESFNTKFVIDDFRIYYRHKTNNNWNVTQLKASPTSYNKKVSISLDYIYKMLESKNIDSQQLEEFKRKCNFYINNSLNLRNKSFLDAL